MKTYKYEDIINNKNLLFDLKNDLIFRNVFLNKCSYDYICKLLHYLLGYDLNDLKNNLKIVNNEYASNSAYSEITRSDIIYQYKDIYIILEMNMSNKEYHINKNYHYLFKQHCSRLNNKNKYKNKTILINVDNYDAVGDKEVVYDAKIYTSKYYRNIYKYIDILHINLDSLRKKVYNGDELNELDKLLIIFVEQDKRKIRGKVGKEVENIMDYMSRLDFREGDPVTYNYIEAEKVKQEMALEHERKLEMKEQNLEVKEQNLEVKEQNLEVKEQELEQNKQNLEVKEQELEQNKQELETKEQALQEEKLSIAKELKKEGFPIQKILKITKLSEKIVTML